MTGDNNPTAKHCKWCVGKNDDIFHILTDCKNKEASDYILNCFRKIDAGILWFDILYLQIEVNDVELERATIILASMAIYFLWENKDRGISAFEMKCELGAANIAVCASRYAQAGKKIRELL